MGNENTALQRVEEVAQSVQALSGGNEAFQVAQRMARALAASTVVPADYRGNIANVMVAMEYANRLGASVLAVMQNLDVIHGRPGLRATFLIGTVNASGRFSPIRWRFQGTEGTDDWGARAVATDLHTGDECVGPLITIATAKAEGWYNKSGSKWKTIPELMLMYRSAGWWTRLYCPELSLGLHTADEVEDMGPPPEVRGRQLAAVLDAGDDARPADYEIHTNGQAEAGSDGEGVAGSTEAGGKDPAPPAEADRKALETQLTELMLEKSSRLFNDKDARKKWLHRHVQRTALARCTDEELRLLIERLQAGDISPEEPAAATATTTPFDDDDGELGQEELPV